MPTKARQLASATISRRSRTGRRRLMSLHVRDVHYEVHARAPAIKFSASRAGGAASAPHALPALGLAAVLAASCQYVLYLGAEPFGREYPGASSARTPSTRRMYRMLGRWVGCLAARAHAAPALHWVSGWPTANDLMSCGLMSCDVLVSGHGCSCLAT